MADYKRDGVTVACTWCERCPAFDKENPDCNLDLDTKKGKGR